MANCGTLYTPSGYHRSWRALIAAKYAQKTVHVHNFVPGETDADKVFLSKFPPSTVPVFEAADGTCLFDANAIAFYVGNEQLRGGNLGHLVTQWTNYADNILPSVATWVYPCLGVTQYNKQNTEKAKSHLQTALTYVNNLLRNMTFLVGDRISQADIAMFTALQPLMTHVLDANGRKPYPHLIRWYTTIANQPEVVEVVGPCTLCEHEAHFDAKKYAELHKDSKSKPQETAKGKTQDTPKTPKPSKPTPVEVESKVEKKSALASLPIGNFNMDEFKRVFSNEDIETVAIPYFWDHFDPKNQSIWYCEYLYPEDLQMLFMSSNLIGGMFNRLEKMLKYAFGSMCIFGEDYKSTISGVWFWHGTGLIFEADQDLQVDYDCYSWRKLDPNAPETKALVRDYFSRKFADKPFKQCKIYK